MVRQVLFFSTKFLIISFKWFKRNDYCFIDRHVGLTSVLNYEKHLKMQLK